MRVKTIITLMLMALMLVALASCDSLPQDQVDEATAALDAAKKAEADKYVPEMYNAAKQALDKAMAVVKEEDSAMFGNFDEARNLLTAAKTAADQAAQAVSAKKEEVKAEVQALLAKVPAEVKAAMDAWRRAPRGKGTREALEQIKAEIAQAEAAQAEVNTAVANGDYLTAKQKVQAISKKLQDIQAELKR
jgi:hypothetical protein